MRSAVIQVVPYLPPSISGVGDYALLLAGELRRAYDIDTRFLVGNLSWNGPSEVNGFSVVKVKEPKAEDLETSIRNSSDTDGPLLLQYVGYGYEKRGCPVWLVRGLERWRDKEKSRGLITMFHELYAFGPFWRSSFWTFPVQKRLVKRLANISDHCQTNMRMYARILGTLSSRHRNRIPVLPVFSNMGEPSRLVPLVERKRQMVVLGSPYWRREVYTRYLQRLKQACHLLQTETIVDAGMPTGLKLEVPLRVIELGKQSAEDASRLLAESLAGFFSYFDGYLAKSGIFAAYCAHGLLPVLASRNCSELDGVRAGREYLAASSLPDHVSDLNLQAIATNANSWYREHSLAKTAATIAAALK